MAQTRSPGLVVGKPLRALAVLTTGFQGFDGPMSRPPKRPQEDLPTKIESNQELAMAERGGFEPPEPQGLT